MNNIANINYKNSSHSQIGFPTESEHLENFGFKFSSGGAHISRTMMLRELGSVLLNIKQTADAVEYRDAIIDQNLLNKSTDSTRMKTLRHLRELYALDVKIPIFGLLQNLYTADPNSLPLMALQVAWTRDPLLRATTPAVIAAKDGELVETSSLSQDLEIAFPNQYSELNRNKIARNAASSWTQSGHLFGRVKKIRQLVTPSVAAVTMALYLGEVAGYHGASIFSNPWCRLLDLSPDSARTLGKDAHRAGLLNLRVMGEVVDMSFPLLAKFYGQSK